MIKYTVGFIVNENFTYVGKCEEGNLKWTEDLYSAIVFNSIEETRILCYSFGLVWLPVFLVNDLIDEDDDE